VKTSLCMPLPSLKGAFGGCKSTFGVSSIRFDRNSGFLVLISPKESECGRK
jgi:hypothetical protein